MDWQIILIVALGAVCLGLLISLGCVMYGWHKEVGGLKSQVDRLKQAKHRSREKYLAKLGELAEREMLRTSNQTVPPADTHSSAHTGPHASHTDMPPEQPPTAAPPPPPPPPHHYHRSPPEEITATALMHDVAEDRQQHQHQHQDQDHPDCGDVASDDAPSTCLDVVEVAVPAAPQPTKEAPPPTARRGSRVVFNPLTAITEVAPQSPQALQSDPHDMQGMCRGGADPEPEEPDVSRVGTEGTLLEADAPAETPSPASRNTRGGGGGVVVKARVFFVVRIFHTPPEPRPGSFYRQNYSRNYSYSEAVSPEADSGVEMKEDLSVCIRFDPTRPFSTIFTHPKLAGVARYVLHPAKERYFVYLHLPTDTRLVDNLAKSPLDYGLDAESVGTEYAEGLERYLDVVRQVFPEGSARLSYSEPSPVSKPYDDICYTRDEEEQTELALSPEKAAAAAADPPLGHETTSEGTSLQGRPRFISTPQDVGGGEPLLLPGPKEVHQVQVRSPESGPRSYMHGVEEVSVERGRGVAALPWCPVDKECLQINDEGHYMAFFHTCRIPVCPQAGDPNHCILFSHAPASHVLAPAASPRHDPVFL